MNVPIVTTDWLSKRILDPTIKIIEVSSKMAPDAPYFKGHIPGAINFFWKDLCWHETDRQFISPEELALRLGKNGISDSDRLVLYGEPVQYGTYALWALKMAGHKKLYVLDGSRKKWETDGLPYTKEKPDPAPTEYKVQASSTKMRLGRENLLKNLKKKSRFLLDVRSPEEYSGERVMEYGQFDHGAERGGRIPGAKHLYFREFLNEDDTFKKAEELGVVIERIGYDPDKFEEVVCYCRLSHRATLAWTAISHILGYDNIFIYDGSWTEWGSIVGFPVEK